MRVLSIIHQPDAASGVFGDAVRERGHELDEWDISRSPDPPAPIEIYGAVLVFGGAMHADQDARHPWLREENFFLQRVLDLHLPALGVCLGAQLLAKAAHAPVHPARQPEIGWYEVELTAEAADDPVFRLMPERFDAFQWHYYTYGLPAGAVELARSDVCTQAFRLGDCAWGVQFHAEVTRAEIADWLQDEEETGIERDAIAQETERRIEEWNAVGRELCGGFLTAAERAEALV